MADILGPDGQEYEIDDSELDAALAQGFSVKPPPEQTYAQKAADVVDSARAGIEGLGRGATFGLTDYAQAAGAGLANVISPEAPARAIAPGIDAPVDQTSDFMRGMRGQKAEIDARAAAHPVAAIGGEVVGAIAPALLTGGTTAAPSLAASAARLTPAAVTSSLAARAAARILPNAAASAAGRIGAAATAGALENATQGAARRVFDSLAQGDHEISAERMVGGLGDVVSDAAIGGLAGGLLGGAIEGGQAAYGWAKNKTGQLIEKVAQKPAAEIPKEITFNLELAQVDPEQAITAAGPLTAQEIGQVADNQDAGVFNDVMRGARGAADAFGDTQQGAVRSISKNLSEFAKLDDELRHGLDLTAKRNWASDKMGKGLIEEVPVLDEAGNVVGVSTQPTGALKSAHEATTQKVGEYLGRYKNLMDQSPVAAGELGGAGSIAKLNDLYEEFRTLGGKALAEGNLGEYAYHADRLKSAWQRVASGTKNNYMKPIFRADAEDFRLHMERPDVFGQDWADMQRVTNRSTTEKIRSMHDPAARSLWKKGSEESVDPFEVLNRPNEQYIDGLLKQIGNPENNAAIAGDEAAIIKHLRATALDYQNKAAVYGDPAFQAQAKRLGEIVKSIEDSRNAVAFAGKDAAAWNKAKEALSLGNSISLAGPVQGVARGAKWVGSAVGRMAERAIPVEQAVQESSENAVRTMIRGLSPRGGAIAGASAGEIKRAIEQARELDDPESPASARLRAAVEEIAADDPDFAAMAQQKLKDRAAFLNEKAGPALDTSDPFNPRTPPMPRGEAAKLERYAQAAVAPAVALKRLGMGKGTNEDIETLQTLYPRLYQDFVQRVGSEIKATKKLPTMRQRQALHRATGIPAGRLFGPESVAFLQGEYAHPPPEPVQVNNPSAGAPADPMGEGAPGRADAILAGG